MSPRGCRPALIAVSVVAAHPTYGFAQTEVTSNTTFVVRADPKWAKPINEVLARLARPRLHDGPAPRLQFTSGVKVVAERGDTLEAIALRHGLSAGRAASLKVIPKGHHFARRIQPGDLSEGDVVVIKKVPFWTDVVTAGAVDRSALVGAIAKALECPDAPETCLPRQAVFVIGGAKKSASPPSEPHPPEVDRVRLDVLRQLEQVRRMEATEEMRHAQAEARSPRLDHWSDSDRAQAIDPRDRLYRSEMSQAMVGPPAAAAPPLVVAALPVAAVAGPAPVDPKQWPYDSGLVAAILTAKPEAIRHDAIIGIADGGLADAGGLPLPAAVYIAAGEKNTSDGVDEDGNKSVDDVFGGGVSDEELSQRSGDVSICGGDPLPFGTWTEKQRLLASHGSIVSSIAAALRLRSESPDAKDRLLPHLAFYRLLKTACGAQADPHLRVEPMALVKAVQYLYLRAANVVNASYAIESAEDPGLKAALESTLANGEKILVLPAGNYVPGDLDLAHPSPQCLANRDYTDRKTANRVLVVGAATRELGKAFYSNHGERTVRYYAPGEPTGALDINGDDASAADPSTSYAAPYAAFAVGILRSFGIDEALQIRERLSAATWPLFDKSGEPKPNAGVIDLVKVAAVRHHTVEVIEPDADSGQMVRRTYAGELELEPGGKLAVCNISYFESGIHAIRLDDPKEDSDRTVKLTKRNFWDEDRLGGITRTCRPSGILTLHTLDGAVKTFDWANVTHVQLRWFTKG